MTGPPVFMPEDFDPRKQGPQFMPQGFDPRQAAPPPVPDSGPGLGSKIVHGLTSPVRDAFNALLTPVQGEQRTATIGRGGIYRPAMTVDQQNTPGSITPDQQRRAAIHTVGTAASFLPIGLAPELAKGASLGTRVLAGAKTGMQAGAIAGAAQADPAPETSGLASLLERGGGALAGGAAGGLFGGLLPVGGAVASKPIRAIKGLLSGPDPVEQATLKNIFGDLPEKAQDRALGLVGKRLANAQIDPRAVAADMAYAPGQKPLVLGDVGPVNAPRPLGGLAAAASSIPSDAQQELPAFAGARKLGRADRLSSDIQKAAGLSPVDMPQHADAILKNAGDVADEMYGAARRESPRITLSPETKNSFADPVVKSAFQQASGNARIGALTGVREELESPYTTQGTKLMAALADKSKAGYVKAMQMRSDLANALAKGRFMAPAGPDGVQMLDLERGPMLAKGVLSGEVPIQDALDTEVGSAWGKKEAIKDNLDPQTYDRIISRIGEKAQSASAKPGQRDAASVLGSLKSQLMGELEDQAPTFAEARQGLATAHARARAAQAGDEIGQKFNSMTQPQIAASIAEHAPEHLPDLRAAALGRLQGRIMDGKFSDLMDPAQAYGKDTRLGTLFGGDAADKFRASVYPEQQMHGLEQSILSGSRTAPLAADMAQMSGAPMLDQALSAGRTGVTFGPKSMVRKMLFNALAGPASGMESGMTSDIASATGKLLLQGKGGNRQLLDALDLLARRREALLPTKATSRTASGLLGNTFARPIAGLLSSGEQP